MIEMGEIVTGANPEWVWKTTVLADYHKVMNSYILAKAFKGTKKQKIYENDFKVQLMGLYLLLEPKFHLFPKNKGRLRNALKSFGKYIDDPQQLKMSEATKLFRALGRLIELLGYTRFENKTTPADAVFEDLGIEKV